MSASADTLGIFPREVVLRAIEKGKSLCDITIDDEKITDDTIIKVHGAGEDSVKNIFNGSANWPWMVTLSQKMKGVEHEITDIDRIHMLKIDYTKGWEEIITVKPAEKSTINVPEILFRKSIIVDDELLNAIKEYDHLYGLTWNDDGDPNSFMVGRIRLSSSLI